MKKLIVVFIVIIMLAGCGERPPQETTWTLETETFKCTLPKEAFSQDVNGETIIYGDSSIIKAKMLGRDRSFKNYYKEDWNGYVTYVDYNNQTNSGEMFKHICIPIDDDILDVYIMYGELTDKTPGMFLDTFELK